MTRSPMSACIREAPAPIEQLRPMRTPGPITALAAMTEPAPISAPGPITAPGSTVTPFSSRAVACSVAPGDTPSAPNSEEGRWAEGNSARATVTNAR